MGERREKGAGGITLAGVHSGEGYCRITGGLLKQASDLVDDNFVNENTSTAVTIPDGCMPDVAIDVVVIREDIFRLLHNRHSNKVIF